MKKKLLMILLVMALGVSSAATAFVAPTSSITAEAKVTSPTAAQVATAVKKAYGDSYLPNYKLDKSAIKDLTGISSTWYSSAYVEMPMISTNVDTLMIFKAKTVAASDESLKNRSYCLAFRHLPNSLTAYSLSASSSIPAYAFRAGRRPLG